MRLNPDCIREILLYTEEHTGIDEKMQKIGYGLSNISDMKRKVTADKLSDF